MYNISPNRSLFYPKRFFLEWNINLISIPHLNVFFLVTIHVTSLELGELVNFGRALAHFLPVINSCYIFDLSWNNLFFLFSIEATLYLNIYLIVIKFFIKLCMILSFLYSKIWIRGRKRPLTVYFLLFIVPREALTLGGTL